MLKKEVPQDNELFGDQREVCYAVDENGRYVLAESAGWEPANLANHQAWEAISDEVSGIVAKIRQNELSPLAYYMAINQMDEKLLAEYSGFYRWQVRRHLKPGPFSRLNAARRQRYATLFSISVEELGGIPEQPGVSVFQTRPV